MIITANIESCSQLKKALRRNESSEVDTYATCHLALKPRTV